MYEDWEARLQIYVNDPILTAAGTRQERDHLFTLFLCALLVLGLDAAFHKAQRGPEAT